MLKSIAKLCFIGSKTCDTCIGSYELNTLLSFVVFHSFAIFSYKIVERSPHIVSFLSFSTFNQKFFFFLSFDDNESSEVKSVTFHFSQRKRKALWKHHVMDEVSF